MPPQGVKRRRAGFSLQQLGIIQKWRETLGGGGGQHHRRSQNGTRQRAAPYLVHTCDPAS
jgi:hypothetical protein